MSGELEALAAHLTSQTWPELFPTARAILAMAPDFAPAVLAVLTEAARQETLLHPCIRDIWHEHVLYEGDRVSGLIDFGSLRIESVAADVARLLGSMVLDDEEGWHAGIEAYGAARPLSPGELRLVKAFDHSTVLMSGLNWIELDLPRAEDVLRSAGYRRTLGRDPPPAQTARRIHSGSSFAGLLTCELTGYASISSCAYGRKRSRQFVGLLDRRIEPAAVILGPGE